MKIAIVGAEESKWTKELKAKAKLWIINRLTLHDSALDWEKGETITLVSGHCPKGGIDIWAEEIADKLGIKKEIYKPEINQWNDEEIPGRYVYGVRRLKGFKSRNIQIAKACDILYDIEPKGSCWRCEGSGKKISYPFTVCQYCKGDGSYSGATWTKNYAEKDGKIVKKVIIKGDEISVS